MHEVAFDLAPPKTSPAEAMGTRLNQGGGPNISYLLGWNRRPTDGSILYQRNRVLVDAGDGITGDILKVTVYVMDDQNRDVINMAWLARSPISTESSLSVHLYRWDAVTSQPYIFPPPTQFPAHCRRKCS